MIDAAGQFENFSALHLLTVLLFALFWLLLIGIGRRLRGSAAERDWRLGLCVFMAVAWVLANGLQLLPGVYVAAQNLPLQICDIAAALAPLALWRRTRLLLGTLYFWGMGFSVQAIATPELGSGPGGAEFWMFWVPHANLTGAACYALAVERFRPDWADCARAYGLSVLYLALILPFDLLTGFNYGYVGPATLAQKTLLDLLGPWPWRIAGMMGAAALGFVLLQMPWVRPRRASEAA